ncbi:MULTISPECIES: CaiB/BaiF CoA-transferase family protein [unclassified Bacillus (in: firmicutes)]|uniref:CaiB/BaiF CoA transferase family protein n=1 Tax=unclassified Bacillus (in: firmicutes) TaxID=185979 RepID=UPI001596F50E|nr:MULTISPECIES: CoA transferase [unclassified Bacillus (in: firmicutes)]
MNIQQDLLTGIRVLDFTWSVSGSTTTRILAAMGAEVIKVEWPKTPDMMRFSMYAKEDEPGLDNGAFFNSLNVGKRSFTINIKSAEGMNIVKDLIRKSDVITENFSAGVFEKWGLDYDSLKEINEGIIYMSISGLGHTGRQKNYGTWGPTAAALSGMTYISGLPDTHPSGWGYSILDIVAGYTGAYSVLTALFHKKRTGEGQYIDISQVETALPLVGTNLLNYFVNCRSSHPTGNRSVLSADFNKIDFRGPAACPQNTYRCSGDDANDYCVIAIYDNNEWERFKAAIGQPEWVNDERFADLNGRIQHQDELDQFIEEYTSRFTKYEIMEKLQKYDLVAAAVQQNEDIIETDAQLQFRGLFEPINHPLLGERLVEGIPIKMSESSPYIHKSAPLMGEDNDYVLKEILHFSDQEIELMHDHGVFWPLDMSKDSFKAVRPLW